MWNVQFCGFHNSWNPRARWCPWRESHETSFPDVKRVSSLKLRWTQSWVSGSCKIKVKIHELYCCCSVAKSCLTLRPRGLQRTRLRFSLSLFFTISWSLLRLMSIEAVMPSNHLILCHHLLLPSVFPSIRVFSNELVLCIRWPKHWSFSFSTSPSNEYSGLIFFKIDWFDLLAFQGTLKSLLQRYSSKASILQCSAFFMVQFSHLYMTLEKLEKPKCRFWHHSKVMSLLFNTLSSFIIAFLPRKKNLLTLVLWISNIC